MGMRILPLVLVLPEDVLGRHVEINLRGGEVIVAEDLLQGGEGDQRDYATLRSGPKGASFAVYDEPGRIRLPVDLFTGEGGELRDPETGVEERPDDELLLVAFAGVHEEVGFLGR